MDASNRITIREWKKLHYRDARTDLVNLGRLQGAMDKAGNAPTLADLRTRELRKYLEFRQAALFTYLVGRFVVKPPLGYAMYEHEDYDSVIRWKEQRRNCYVAVQLKEIVPTHLNPKAEINVELAKLAKYVTSEHTVVAFHLNQSRLLDFSALAKPDTSCKEIWLYGALSSNQSQWFLYGNLLTDTPAFYETNYPI